MLKTREAYRRHTNMLKNTCKTSIEMDSDLWIEFKKEVYSLNLTTCLVIRGLIHRWIEAVRSISTPTGTKNGKEGRKHIKKQTWQWIYNKKTMTLYRYPASYVFAPESTTAASALRGLPPNLLRGRISNL